MRRVHHFLTDGQIHRLKTLSGSTGLTVAELVRRFIDEGLDRAEERKKKEE